MSYEDRQSHLTRLANQEYAKRAATQQKGLLQSLQSSDADKATPGYQRQLKGISVEALAAATKILPEDIRRAESGASALLTGKEKRALTAALGRDAGDLLRPLTPEVKAAILHRTPMPEKSS